jgi:hypothetical protein
MQMSTAYSSPSLSAALNSGNVHCFIQLPHDVHVERVLRAEDDLKVSVRLPNLNEMVMADFSFEFCDFLSSGESIAAYECFACRTITKFGNPVTFKQTFSVRFEHSDMP